MSLKAQYSDIKTKHLALADLVKPFISSVKVLTLEAYELLHRNHCSVFATLTSLFDSALGELEKAQNIIEQKDKTIQQQDQTIQQQVEKFNQIRQLCSNNKGSPIVDQILQQLDESVVDIANGNKSSQQDQNLDASGNPQEAVSPISNRISLPHGTEQQHRNSSASKEHEPANNNLVDLINNEKDNFDSEAAASQFLKIVANDRINKEKAAKLAEKYKANKKDKKAKAKAKAKADADAEKTTTLAKAKTYNIKKFMRGYFKAGGFNNEVLQQATEQAYQAYKEERLKCKNCESEELELIATENKSNFISNILAFLDKFIATNDALSIYSCKNCNTLLSDFDLKSDYAFIPGAKHGISAMTEAFINLLKHDIAVNMQSNEMRSQFQFGHNVLSESMKQFSSVYFAPVVAILNQLASNREILHVDETHYRVLIEEGKFKECDASLADQAQGDYCLIEKGSKAYIVTMVTPDLDSIKLALYSYSRGRTNLALEQCLDKLFPNKLDEALSSGKYSEITVLVTDGYQFYELFSKTYNVKLQKCVIHLRREFIKAANCKEYYDFLMNMTGPERADYLNKCIKGNNAQLICNLVCSLTNSLFAYERVVSSLMQQANEANCEEEKKELIEQARNIRNVEMRSIFLSILDCVKPLEEHCIRYNKKTNTYSSKGNTQYAKAIVYLLNNKDALMPCFDDPRLPIHNNSVERIARPVARYRNTIDHQVSSQHTKAMLDALSVLATFEKNGKNPHTKMRELCMEIRRQYTEMNIQEQSKARIFDASEELEYNFGSLEDYQRYSCQLDYEPILRIIFDDESLDAINKLDLETLFKRAQEDLRVNSLRDLRDHEYRCLSKASERYNNDLSETISDVAEINQQVTKLEESVNSGKDLDSCAEQVDTLSQAVLDKRNKVRALSKKIKKSNTNMNKTLQGYIDNPEKPNLVTSGTFGLKNLTNEQYLNYKDPVLTVTNLIEKQCPKLDLSKFVSCEDKDLNIENLNIKDFNPELVNYLTQWEKELNALSKSADHPDVFSKEQCQLNLICTRNSILYSRMCYKRLISFALHIDNLSKGKADDITIWYKALYKASVEFKRLRDRAMNVHSSAYNYLLDASKRYVDNSVQSKSTLEDLLNRLDALKAQLTQPYAA